MFGTIELIALVVVEVSALIAMIVLVVRWGGMPIRDVLVILGMALAAAAIASIAIWTLAYGALHNLS